VSADRGQLGRRYARALHAALADGGDEGALSAAYDIGRDAVRQGLSLMDLAAVHNAALVEELRAAGAPAAERTARAAGDFFLESVSAYEMLARVLRQTSEMARLEQRHAALLRRLSGFLADASLAVDAHASLQEVLQLVAEHALEVVEADACSARLEPSEGEGAVREAEALTTDAAPDPGIRERLADLYGELGSGGGALRLDPAAVAERLPGTELAWLAAPFMALDGRVIGSLALYSLGADRAFSAVDEAVVVQLAQMGSATFERMDRYRR
jgi:Phosphoserine phosphatase RsbU, N-terminal domain